MYGVSGDEDSDMVDKNGDALIKTSAAPDGKTFMYYLNDGVYGSFNCILFDHAVVEPDLYDVSI